MPDTEHSSPVIEPTSTAGKASSQHSNEPGKGAFLTALGARVRAIRTRRGLSRREVAETADVSERHLANLEYGHGNVSILVLLQIANALQRPLAELIGDVTTSTPEWLLLRELLEGRDEDALRHARVAIGRSLSGHGKEGAQPSSRIALLGLRGAGKSTLGRMLADDLAFPFVELSTDIERLAGCSTGEIQALYGADAYRRYERRALEDTIGMHREAVIAAPGGLVADAGTFNTLLRHCTSVWLRAEPEDHLARVTAQGDLRPMAASVEAMADLKQILSGRTPFYSRAEFSLDTSLTDLPATFSALRSIVRAHLSPSE